MKEIIETIDKRISLDEYLESLPNDAQRWEYRNGTVVDVRPSTPIHGLLRTNLTGLITNSPFGKKCDVFLGDRELWLGDSNMLFYPDLVVIDGKNEMKKLSKYINATVNPTIVIEILSDFSEIYDLTTKRRCYKQMTGLKQIIFVASKEKFIEISTRSKNNERTWNVIEYFEDDEMIPIGDCVAQLKDIYEDVTFPIGIIY